MPEQALPVAEPGELLDGFEGPAQTVWAFDAADDEADSAYVAEGVTQGRRALRMTLRGKGRKGKLHLRREIALDLSAARALSVDVRSPAPGASIALALKSDPHDVYQESRAVPLAEGLNRGVRFPLSAPNWKNAESKWEFSGPPVNLKDVKRLMLLVYTDGLAEGAFLLDNLRLEGDPRAAYREWRPEILAHTPIRTCEQHATLEVGVLFRASYRDLFDSGEIAAGLRVTAPDGRAFAVPGFFAGVAPGPAPASAEAPDAAAPPPFWGPFKPEKDAKTGKDAEHGPEKVPVWVVRFTPALTGRYTVQLWVRNRAGETRAPEQGLVVTPQEASAAPPGRRGGQVRLARRDPRQFELQDGSPFFVLGQNVCWTTDWEPYLKKIAAYGGNCCRIWLCPWGLALERKTEPGVFDLEAAQRLDRLFEQAEQTGVRIVFCFTFHGATASFWNDQPYARANGGPCARPQDFFTNHEARAQFKGLLEYACARWGASPALLAWEVINEADLALYDRAADVEAWVLEMAGHLKASDPHGHLVTASTAHPGFRPALWDDPRLDIVCHHGYGADVPEVLYESLAPRAAVAKPFLLTEFGGGWDPGDDVPDRKGVRLQAALWLSACSPSAGAALPWWWDTHIEAHGLYGPFAALGRFLQGDDRRGRFGHWVKKELAAGVEVHGVMDEQGARLYLFRPGWVRQPESRQGEMLAAPAELALTGVLDGSYRVALWDAAEGKPLKTWDAAAEGSVLKLKLPACAGECALKVDRQARQAPGLETGGGGK